jgi:dipeptidyl aminopeptidase/acylaminoacyl peptidase
MAAAILLTAGAGASAGAAAPARWIVFSATPLAVSQVQAEQLFRIRTSGDGLKQLTTGALPSVAPAFSPDGKRIAFARLGVGILTMNLDGTGLRRLTTNGRDSYPTWSPDGRSIAFVRPVGTEWRLLVMSSSGATPRLLAKAPPSGRPSWRKVGLLSPSGGDLLKIDVTTGHVLKYYGANIDATWGLNTVAVSPDLSKLTYIGARSPDPGDKECGEGPCQRFGLYLESLKSKSKRPRLLVKDVGPATFSPDGGHIVYVADGRLTLRSLTGGASTSIATGSDTPTDTAPPAWQPR